MGSHEVIRYFLDACSRPAFPRCHSNSAPVHHILLLLASTFNPRGIYTHNFPAFLPCYTHQMMPINGFFSYQNRLDPRSKATHASPMSANVAAAHRLVSSSL